MHVQDDHTTPGLPASPEAHPSETPRCPADPYNLDPYDPDPYVQM